MATADVLFGCIRTDGGLGRLFFFFLLRCFFPNALNLVRSIKIRAGHPSAFFFMIADLREISLCVG